MPKARVFQGWLACGVRRKSNQRVRADAEFVDSMAQERQKSSTDAKKEKCKGLREEACSDLER